jgi:hypothetical protein
MSALGNMKAWRPVCEFCWRKVAPGKKVCFMGGEAAHGKSKAGGPVGFQNVLEAKYAGDSTRDDELGHDDDFDVENWEDCESEDEVDKLTEEQEVGGFLMIGMIVKDKKTKRGCVPLPYADDIATQARDRGALPGRRRAYVGAE